MKINHVYAGDAAEILPTLPQGSVNCCITSPPYYGLRDYGTASWEGGDERCDHEPDRAKIKRITRASTLMGGSATNEENAALKQQKRDGIEKCGKCGAKRVDKQVGLEDTPEAYIQKLADIFDSVHKLLRKDGTLWIVIADTYAAYYGDKYGKTNSLGRNRKENKGQSPPSKKSFDFKASDVKPKDLIGIPWMLAFELRKRGWYWRQNIIWTKGSTMPESVKDRCTKSHEYILLFAKSAKYYFDADAISEPLAPATLNDYRFNQAEYEPQRVFRGNPGDHENRNGQLTKRSKADSFKRENSKRAQPIPGQSKGTHRSDRKESEYDLTRRNKRDVWHVNPVPFAESHFATFPGKLIDPMILAACPEGGTVLDPFMGAWTTAIQARMLKRNYVGVELNPKYITLGRKRFDATVGFLNEML